MFKYRTIHYTNIIETYMDKPTCNEEHLFYT